MQKNFAGRIKNLIITRKKLFTAVIWICIILFVLLYNLLNLNLRDLIGYCYLFDKSGIYCPSCGGTRGMHSFLTFNILQSLKYHAIFALAYLGVLTYLLVITVQIFFNKKILRINIVYVTIVFVAALVLFTIVRNIVPVFHIN